MNKLMGEKGSKVKIYWFLTRTSYIYHDMLYSSSYQSLMLIREKERGYAMNIYFIYFIFSAFLLLKYHVRVQ